MSEAELSGKSNKVFPGPELLTVPSFDYKRSSITSDALSDVPSDVIIKSRIRYGSPLSACKGLWLEYARSTTIHGLRYIFALHRPIYEKLYWLVLTCASAYFAVSLIWDTYLKWQDSPVIMGFDETMVPVHKIPFPTITICPEIKMDRNVFDYSNVSQHIWQDFMQNKKFTNAANLSEEDLARMAATLHVCDSDVASRFAPLLRDAANLDITQMLVDLSISKNQTGPFCKWNGRFYFCNKIFDFVPTDEGICYQFNGLRPKDIYRDERFVSYADPDVVNFNDYFDMYLPPLNDITGNWSLGTGYVGQIGPNAYPQRLVLSSARNGFFAFLQGFEHNYDYDCRSFKQGYKVFLNSPESVPLTSGNYFLVPHGFEVMVTVLPNYIVSTENLHEISPEKRQCFFDDERELRFFRSYSQSNCQTECLANFTIAQCGCAKFWMPKPLGVPICGLADIKCYTTAQDELNAMLQNQTAQQTKDSSAKAMCDCMPACTSLDYNFEISRSRYSLERTLKAFRETYEHTDAVASRLSVYYKEHQFTAIKRTILFGVSTLISNCGGIFGLFMGISSLSFIELIYFFFMRIFSSCRDRYKVKRQMIAHDQLEPTEEEAHEP